MKIFLILFLLCFASIGHGAEVDGTPFKVHVDSPNPQGVETCFYFFDKFSGKWIVSGWYQLKNGNSKLVVDTKYPVVGYVGTAGKHFYSSEGFEHDVLYHDVTKDRFTIQVGEMPKGKPIYHLGFILAPMKDGQGSMNFTDEFLYTRSTK